MLLGRINDVRGDFTAARFANVDADFPVIGEITDAWSTTTTQHRLREVN